MIFVDTNVFIYAVGREHPNRIEARTFFQQSLVEGSALVSSAEVMQELMHIYLPVNRQDTLERALQLMQRFCSEIWPMEVEDVQLAHRLLAQHPELGARDLCHLASCRRRKVSSVMSFDKRLSLVATRFL